ncbi:hypothetical protein M6D81_22905 [Paenibacillus sp. J5C_2022]|uniref:hypothetical protein n=1 Tax=Paenibacillus sp. J5C2022 TaxID=2977129 RepID=UPI0021D34A22|nr:hypothetical protein [Paenibacillus sp. J5C2022]MCU6711550.1 hypothetical protein [Paenibacillus sp. J5C2022]
MTMEMECERCIFVTIDKQAGRKMRSRQHVKQEGDNEDIDPIPIPYERVELWLKSYKDWKARLKYVQSEQSYIPELTRTLQVVAAHNNGRKQETVLRMVIQRIEITEHEIPLLLSRIGLIDYAFSALTPEESMFIQMRYMDQMALSVAMSRLALSRRAYFYLRKRALHKIYMKVKDREVLLDLDSFH